MNSIRERWLRVGVSAVALVSALLAAERALAQDRPLDRQRVRELVEKSLPAFDRRVLDAKDGNDWSGRLSIGQVLDAVKDRPLPKSVAPGERRVADEARVVRLYGERGKVRYVSRERAWNIKESPRTPIDRKTANEVVTRTVGALGLPNPEFGKMRVAAQIAQGTSTKERSAMERFEMYAVVSLGRMVNGLPVYGSRARAAVTHSGAIQRLQVDWPAFRVPSGLALRSHEEVVSRAVSEITAQQPQQDTVITAYLAYAPIDVTQPYRAKKPSPPAREETARSAPARDRDDETTYSHPSPPRFRSSEARRESVRFIPAVVFSVQSLPTPYQVVVPIAGAR